MSRAGGALRYQAARLAACALIALGLAMIATSVRPMRRLQVDALARPGFSDDDLHKVRERTLAAAAWFDRVSMLNGALLVVLGAGWLVRPRRGEVVRTAAQDSRNGATVHSALNTQRVGGTFTLAAIAILALLIRLPGLGHSLWYDEIYTVQHYLTTDYRGVATDFSAPNNHILYSLALKTWDELLPVTLSRDGRVVAWRVLSVLLGIAAVLAAGALARRTIGGRGAIGTMLLLAAWPIAVDLSQQLRGYALAMGLSATSTALLLHLLRGGRGWTAYVALCAAMLYTHPLTIVVLVGQAVAVVLDRPIATHLMRRSGLAFLIIAMATAQLYAVLVPDALANAREQASPQVTHSHVAGFLLNVCRDLGARAGPAWISVPFAAVAVIGAARLVRAAPCVGYAVMLPPVLLIVAGAVWPPLRETRFLPFVAPHVAVLIIAGTLVVGSSSSAPPCDLPSLRPRAKQSRLAAGAWAAYAAICCGLGLWSIYRFPVQAIREAVTASQPEQTAVVGLGAPEATFYNPRVIKAFAADDLTTLAESGRIARVVVLYPQTWLAQAAQARLREILGSIFPKQKEFAGRLPEDPTVVEYRR